MNELSSFGATYGEEKCVEDRPRVGSSNVNSVAVESSWVRSGAGRGRFEDRVEAIVFLGVIYVMCSKQR